MSLPTSLSNHVAADSASDVGRLALMIRTALAGVRTAIPVQVVACTNDGGVAAIGTVDVIPLVSGVDGSGKLWRHGTVYQAPYERLQAGTMAVIMDPAPGDIGLAVVCDRDISGVLSAKGVAGPASGRRHDLSDLVYLRTIIAAAPGSYLQFQGGDISMVSAGQITLQAPAINIVGPVNQSGGTATLPVINATTSIQVAGKDVGGHYHGSVQPGSGFTGGMAG